MLVTSFPVNALAYPDVDVEEPLLTEAPVAEMEAASERIAPLQTGIVHPISNANFAQFLSGTLGGSADTFRLTENINFPAAGLASVGRPGVFSGTFDGDGFTIFDLRFMQGGTNIGLFQTIGGGAIIENVTLSVARFNSDGSGGWATAVNGFGFIAGNVAAGTTAATIRNITIANAGITIGGAAHTNTRLGGLVGRVDTGATLHVEGVTIGSTLQTNAGTTAGATGNFAGGLVGENSGNLHVRYLEVQVDDGYGVLVPATQRNTINVPITHTGTARFTRAGGVVGASTGGAIIIEHTDVLGAVNAGAHAGGVVGHTGAAGSVTIRDTVVSVNTAARVTIQTNAAGDVGGMIGLAANLTRLERVENHAIVHAQTGAANLGGLVGRATGQLDIRDGTNTGNINHQPAAIQRSGGLVGWSTNRIEINGGFNSGHLTSPGTNRDAANRMGGIVGRADHAAAAANRRIIIHNVENTGNIVRPVHTAGGIVGHITGGTAADITQVTNAINRGNVPTRQNGGGIVGGLATPGTLIGGLRAGAFLPGATVPLNAVQAAEQTRGSLNYGTISTSLDGQSTSAGRRNASIGGIIGNNVATSINVHQAGNYGRVDGLHRTTGTAASSRGGSGGIIGRQAGGSALIQQVFNMGHISSAQSGRTDSSRMVGGIVGHQRAGGIIEDFYSVGPVTSTGGNRRASGIIGMRTSGTMAVRRGYVATRIGANDLMLGTSGTTAANPAVTGMSFTQVYVLNTIGPPTGTGGVAGGTDANRNILQNHRGGILVGSDMLAMGVLPGISGGPWRSGIVEIEGTAADRVEGQSSLPYFAWQTAHTASGMQERFFYQITGGHLFAPTPATGSSTISFTGVRYPEATRMFDPRNHIPAAVTAGTVGRPLVDGPAGSVTVAHHNVLGTSATPNGRLTWGLISPDGVIGFGAAATSNVFIVQAVDADCPQRSPIAHAQFTAQPGMEIELSTDGILAVRIGTVVPNNWVSATALGFHPSGNVNITDNDISIGSMEIEMRRAPINRAINVFVRDGSREMPDDVNQPNLFNATGGSASNPVGTAQADSTRFEHIERLVPTTGTVPGSAPWTPEWAPQYTYRAGTGTAPAGVRWVVGAQGDTRLAQIPAGETMVGQAMRAGSAGFDWETFAFCVSMIDEITTGTGALTMTIDLEDVRLTTPVPVRVVEHTVNEAGDDVFTNIPNATLTAVHEEGRIPPLGTLGVTGNNPFQLAHATMHTILTAGAPGFITRVVDAGEVYEPYQPAEDGEPAVPASVMIVLEPEVIFDVLVVEEIMRDGVVVQRPIGGAALYLDDTALPGSGEEDNAGLFLDVTTQAGSVVVASADGFYFYENSHVVASEDHGRTMESGDPVVIVLIRETPPPGTIRGFVWDAYTGIDTIPNATVVLMRQTADGWELADNTTTNAFGFFTFTGVDTPGTYRVLASHENFVTNTAEMDPIELGLSEGVLTDVYLDRRVGPRQDYILLVDVISSDTGQPIAAEDATVTFNGTAMTHDGETWRVTLPAATAGTVRVEAEGYRLGVATVEANSFAFNFRFVRVILNPLPELPPQHGGIHGFVTHHVTNAAIPNASVVITDAAGAVVFNGLTDTYGRYEAMPLPVGAYTVVVSRPGFVPQSRQVTVTDTAMTRADFALMLDSTTEPYEYTLQVIVATDPAGPTPAGTEVRIIDGASLARVGTSNVWILHTANPLAGEEVIAGAPMHHSDSDEIGAYEERVASVALTLKPHALEDGMGGIRGTVTAATGNAPIADATVIVSNAEGIVHSTTTDVFGRYAAFDLEPGSYTVTVVRTGFITQTRNTTVTADTWTTEDFALVAGGAPGNYTLVVTVTGAPAATVTVTTANATLTRIGTSNLWEARTTAPLPGEQAVSATADEFHPGSGTVGAYTSGVASVTIALQPITSVPVTITFDANGGAPNNQTATVDVPGGTYGDAFDQITEPTRRGYRFDGWTLEGTLVTEEMEVERAVAHTLVARWEASDITVIFDGNNGTPAGQERLVRVGTTYGTTLAGLTEPTRGGHRFLGWFTAPTGGEEVTATTVVSGTDERIFAQWEQAVREITLRGTPGGTPAQQVVYGFAGETYADVFARATTPTREGFTAIGWRTESLGWGVLVEPETPVTTTSPDTLYVWWQSLSAGMGIIEGHVRANGNPLATAFVTAVAANGTRVTVPVDSDGYFIIMNLAPGAYTVIANADGFNTVVREAVAVVVDESTVVNFDLTAGANAYTLLVNASPGTATVVFSGGPLTGTDGTWQATGNTPMVGAVTATAEGFYSGRATVAAADYNNDARLAVVTLNLAQIEVIPGTGTIRGYVLENDASGAPIPNAIVTVRAASGAEWTVRTNAAGFYAVPGLAAGNYTVFASAGGFSTNISDTTPVVVTSDTFSNANVYLTPGTANRFMLVVNVTPVNADVTFSGGTLTETAPGIWVVRGNAAMSGNITATADGYRTVIMPVLASEYDLETGLRIVNINLNRIDPGGGILEGVVTDAATGDGIVGATVVVFGEDGTRITAVQTGAGGRYEITDLSPGRYVVTAGAFGFSTGISDTNPAIVAGGASTTANVALNQGDNTHLLLVNVVNATTRATINTATVTFNDTEVAFNGTQWHLAQPGAVGGRVIASATGYYPGFANVASTAYINNVAFVTVPLVSMTEDPGTGILRGLVRERGTNAAIEGATVQIMNANGVVVRTVTTNVVGFYEVTGLAEGIYTVVASAPTFSTGVAEHNPITVGERGAHANVYLERGDRTHILFVDVLGGTAERVTLEGVDLTAGTPHWQLGLTEAETGLVVAQRQGMYPGMGNVTDAHWNGNIGFIAVTLQDKDTDPGAGILRGVVYNAETDQPIARALVTVLRADGTVRGTVETNIAGFYEVAGVEPGDFTIIGSAEGFAPNFADRNPVTVGANGANADIFLTPGANAFMVVATVVDEDGAQVPGTNVTFAGGGMTRDGNVWVWRGDSAVTGQVRATAPDHIAAVANVTTYQNGLATVRLVLREIEIIPGTATLAGEVMSDDTGLAIAGAAVMVLDGAGNVVETTETDAAGFYVFVGLEPGTYTIAVSATSYVGEVRTGVTLPINAITTENFELERDTVPPTRSHRLMVFVEGAPQADVTLTFTGGTLTEENGFWQWIGGSAQTGDLLAIADGFEGATGSVAASDYVAGIAIVRLTLEPVGIEPGRSGIAGTVTAAAGGAPVANATVTVVDAEGVERSTTTAANGTYRILNIAPGAYTVYVVAPNFYSQSRTGTVAADQMATEDFQLVAGHPGLPYVLTAIVTGAPANAVTVTMGETTLTRIDTSNMWETRGTAPMTGNTVTASANSFRTATATVPAHEDGVARVSIELQPIAPPTGYGGIFGVVTGPDGPIAGALVVIANAENVVVDEVRTGADGSYTTDFFVPGAYRVTVIAPGYVSQSQAVAVTADTMTEANFTLVAGPPADYALIVTVTGAPAEAVTVTLGETTLTRITGTNVWEHQSMSPITGTVAASAADHFTARAEVPAAENGIARVSLVLEAHGLEPSYAGIYGYVTADNVAVADAVVIAVGAGGTPVYTTTTNAAGRYVFRNLRPGSFTVTVVTPGFEIATATVAVNADQMARRDFALEEAPDTVNDRYVLLTTVQGGPEASAVTVLLDGGRALNHLTDNIWILRGPAVMTNLMVEAAAEGYRSDSQRVPAHDAVTRVAEVALSLTGFDFVDRTFNAAGGAPASQTIGVALDSTYGVAKDRIEEPTKEGHQFLGWFTAPEGGNPVAREEVVTYSGNRTLYAQWRTHGVAGPIRGHVFVAGTETPIPHAEVAIVDAAGDVQWLNVDANGFFETEVQPPGAYTVMAAASGFLPNISETNPAVVETAEGVVANIYLEEGTDGRYMMFITVIDAVNRPVPNATVTFNDQVLARDGNVWTRRMSLAARGTIITEAEGFRRNSLAVDPTDFTNGLAFLTVRMEHDPYELLQAYMIGDNHGNFRPGARITRAEVATILTRTMVSGYSPDAPVPDISGRFSDVSPGMWHYRYVAWAYTAGLIQGTDEGTFLPNEPITREQIAAMVARADTVLTYQAGGLNNFGDQITVSGWARNYVYTVFRLGWMHGDDRGEFNPQGQATRAEVATTINRILGRDNLGSDSITNVMDDVVFFPDVPEHGWFYWQVISATNSRRVLRTETGAELWVEVLPVQW